MSLSEEKIRQFFQACNPSKSLDYGNEEQQKYYVDFAKARGGIIIDQLAKTITRSDDSTCQLFTGHIGCGKSTELLVLKDKLQREGFHVVYFEGTNEFDKADVDISDILLAITRQVSRNLENLHIQTQAQGFRKLLKGAVDLLNSEFKGLKINIPGLENLGVGYTAGKGEFSLAFGIGQLNLKAKASKDIRGLLREYMNPQINTIIKAINEELLEPAREKLKSQLKKKGLVVIVDNLDRIDNKLIGTNRTLPEYLFVDQGEQLKQLHCHVIYTIPLVLTFSNDQEIIRNCFGSEPKVLPMVRIREGRDDDSLYEEGLNLLKQLILLRAFPHFRDYTLEEQLALISEIFNPPEMLDLLCTVSGGHVRNLLVLLFSCLQQEDPPFSEDIVKKVITERRCQIRRTIGQEEWKLLKQIAHNKKYEANEEDQYQSLVKSSFVFEYSNQKGEIWYDINPVIADAEELN